MPPLNLALTDGAVVPGIAMIGAGAGGLLLLCASVGRCRLTVSTPVFKAPMLSALEARML
jgi:hypothetical protein